MVNPLTRCTEDYSLPPYAVLRASDVAPAVRAAIAEYTLDLNALEDDLCEADLSTLTWESVMDRLEIIDDPLEKLATILKHLSWVTNSPELRAACGDVQSDIVEIKSRCAHSDIVFRALQALRASPAYEADFTVEQQRILDRAIFQAKLKGATLSPNDKERFKDISLRLDYLKKVFDENLLDAIRSFSLIVTDKDELEGVSLATRTLLAKNAVMDGHRRATAATGPWKLSLDFAAFMPVMKQCSHRPTREVLYRAFMTKASTPPFDNTPIIGEILQLRQAHAHLLGFQSYAELSFQDKMAPSVQVVDDMLCELRDKCLPLSKAELDNVAAFAKQHGHTSRLESWDVAFWSEKLRMAQYAVDDEVIKPYFPLPKVLAGLFQLCSDLFGIDIEAADGLEKVWHSDVSFFQARATDKPGAPVVGQFFVDPYSRPEQKRVDTWCTPILNRSKVLRTAKAPVRLPVFSLECNHPPPGGDGTSSLLSFSDVLNLTYTFGHGIRMMLTTADHTAASSVDGIEGDAIEIPSQFLSTFCYRPEVLRMMSGHFVTGAPMPDELVDSIVKSRNFMAATELLRQLRLGATDLALHHSYDPYSMTVSAFDVHRSIFASFSVQPPYEHDKSLCSFNHIFSLTYAAGYYSYIWSSMLTADMGACTTDQEEWQDVGRRFRDKVIANLGILDPMTAYKLFRGQVPRADALLARYGLI
ncbi:hypothetical protein H310_11365 [Aphanomyces invadans]|uniref:oligopeptidase A n=1 Tax=Aphanomyces invadans TaxID=157072 RepID=A0A024TN59_9STRA|nr:hypothetical protein H310_11365 [Aphanomyces invadans]ETV95071.1 hypothetical protein H310_11365 [Aphanomyces invadans]|eukprot:XP_008876244.1 hypothetical protein H310_11365 [Aphanomyces invadans]